MPWLVITECPREVTERQVREALGAWRYAARYTPALGGLTALVKVDDPAKAPAAWGLEVNGFRVTWEELEPARRRITVEVDASLWRRVMTEVRREGSSLQAYVVHALELVVAFDEALEPGVAGAVPTSAAVEDAHGLAPKLAKVNGSGRTAGPRAKQGAAAVCGAAFSWGACSLLPGHEGDCAGLEGLS